MAIAPPYREHPTTSQTHPDGLVTGPRAYQPRAGRALSARRRRRCGLGRGGQGAGSALVDSKKRNPSDAAKLVHVGDVPDEVHGKLEGHRSEQTELAEEHELTNIRAVPSKR